MSIDILPEPDVLATIPDEGPVVMVNLLRFRPGGGSKAYGRYAAAFGEMLSAAGGEFLYRGRVAASLVGSESWHAVALVRYPSKRSFVDLVTSPAYAAIHPWRADGLADTRLFATQAYPGTEPE